MCAQFVLGVRAEFNSTVQLNCPMAFPSNLDGAFCSKNKELRYRMRPVDELQAITL